MALSQEQWYETLKSFAPSWMFEKEDLNKAHFQALAKVLSTLHSALEASAIANTFITQTSGAYLDLIGYSRGVDRFAGESDSDYSERIRYSQNTISRPAMEAIINEILPDENAVVIENWNYSFADSDIYADDFNSVAISKTKNYARFTILVPAQSSGDDNQIKADLVKALNENKSLSVFYDILYIENPEFLSLDGGESFLLDDGSSLSLG